MSAPFKAKLFWLLRDADSIYVEGYYVSDDITYDSESKTYMLDLSEYDDDYGPMTFEDQWVEVRLGSCFTTTSDGRKIRMGFQTLVDTGPDHILMKD